MRRYRYSVLFFEIASDFKKYENDTSEYAQTKLNRHKRLLQDFGINENALNEFVEYVIGINTTHGEIKYRLPTVDDLVNETGAIEGIASVYVNAISRAAHEHPRPAAGRENAWQNTAGSSYICDHILYFAFQRNVLIKAQKLSRVTQLITASCALLNMLLCASGCQRRCYTLGS